MTAPLYRVTRHGGNSSHRWRTVLETPLLELAENAYRPIRERLRQGEVRIMLGDVIVKGTGGPRLRTKW